MRNRKQANVMDLPGYAIPPTVYDMLHNAGSWGWVTISHIGQDEDGCLWADGDARPRICLPTEENNGCRALLSWSEEGLSTWVDPHGYGGWKQLGGVDKGRWLPIMRVMAKLPPYGRDQTPGAPNAEQED
mgnify:CR=1 FL=1